MDVQEAISRRRSIRRFSQEPVEETVLYELIGSARLAPSASNLQPLQYMPVWQPELLDAVFDCTKWAGYLPDYAPKAGRKPMAYIIILVNEEIRKQGADTDAGAAVQNILLAAVEKGLGTCWIGSVDRPQITELLGIPENCRIHSLVALGYPAESPVWEDQSSDSIQYYLDETGRIHVPKRNFDDIIILPKQEKEEGNKA